MIKIFLSLGFCLSAMSAKATACSEEILQTKAIHSALSIERLNGGGYPLTSEIYSLNRQVNTYGIIFSYSGVQHIWIVTVDFDQCLIKSVVGG